ncbi:MAG: hypothetical protein JSR77_07405 [Planctomycetes bacterium]|nr:hypothetical protein [Planctomycetota bacterium]
MTLISEGSQLVPGSTAMLGMHFAMSPKWHIYWNGLSDAGFPPSIEIVVPPGFELGEPQWPAPVRHLGEGDVLDHVYEKEATVLVPLKVPASAKPGDSVRLTAASKWLVCDDACVPGEGKSEITLKVGEKAEASASAAKFAAARLRLPKALPTDGSVKTQVVGGVFTATAAQATVRFFPASDCVALKDLPKNGESTTGRLQIAIAGEATPKDRVQGILEIAAEKQESRFYSVDLPAGEPKK